MKSKEINDLLLLELTPMLEAKGYEEYKSKQFIKVNNEVLMYIKLFGNKNDLYIWFSSYPLCMNDLWFGSGIIAGRFPMEEKSLRADNDESLKTSINKLKEGLVDIINFQEDRDNIDALEKLIPNDSNIGELLVKGFCLAAQRKYTEAANFINGFMSLGIHAGDTRKGVEELLASFQNGTTQDLLNNNKIKNIKKLGLRKYIK
jgi:hypothetical protein